VVFLIRLLWRAKSTQKNNLDALCRRYYIDNSQRSLHGALLDARILADVYLAMTGGQTALGLDDDSGHEEDSLDVNFRAIERTGPLPIWTGTVESGQANTDYAAFLSSQCSDPAWK
jgi:DNA polymerase-3 subunit epsilon